MASPRRPDGAPLSETADVSALVRSGLQRASGPRFEVVADLLRDAISSGVIGLGTKLPAERELALRSGVGRVTVSRAYDLLRRDGWARSRTGSGTFAAHPAPVGTRRWMRDIADAGTPLRPIDGGIVNLTMSKPQPITEMLQHSAEAAARRLPAVVAQTEYATQGLPALRQAIASRFTDRGLPTNQHQILITSGAQQAINLIARLHVHPGSTVLTESPTYLGAIDAFRLRDAHLVTFDPLADDAVEQIATTITHRQPSLLFLMTTCHTVTGQVTPPARRRAIAALVEAHQLPVIDDDIFAGLTFEHEPAAPLAAYAEDAPIYTVGSMSKLAWNGLRVGWLRAPEALVTRIARLKGTDDLGTSLVAQVTAHELLEHETELADLRRREARGAVDEATALLATTLPHWKPMRPDGGRSLWVQLPGRSPDGAAFASTAERHGVLVSSGDVFTPDRRHRDHLRLIPVQAGGDLREGVRRLGLAWYAHRAGG